MAASPNTYQIRITERPYTLTMKGAVLLLLVAVLVRLLLLWQRSHEWLGQRIEISTPINQWKRSGLKLDVVCH